MLLQRRPVLTARMPKRGRGGRGEGGGYEDQYGDVGVSQDRQEHFGHASGGGGGRGGGSAGGSRRPGVTYTRQLPKFLQAYSHMLGHGGGGQGGGGDGGDEDEPTVAEEALAPKRARRAGDDEDGDDDDEEEFDLVRWKPEASYGVKGHNG